jgi:hypothetical protein
MALSVLTDSERKVYESMRTTTRTKFEAAFKKSGLPEMTAKILAEIETLRKQNDEIHDNTSWASKFIANVFKSGAGEAEKKYPSRKR